MTRTPESHAYSEQVSYWERVTHDASIAAFERNHAADGLISAEALPEISGVIDFKAFAHDYPEKLFPLLFKLRGEFQELFIEYYLLEKSQYFLAPAHGQIQTRIWQNLRVIEQAIGSLIVLGPEPSDTTIRPILEAAELETTPYGSLTDMIVTYARSQSYQYVAKAFFAPVPAIRKIFRPTIQTLLESKKLHEVAVGCYLRSLTHQASLKGTGLSKSYLRRLRRVKNLKFDAPALNTSPFTSYGSEGDLRDTPWRMFEVSTDHRISKVVRLIGEQHTKLFGTKRTEIFAPVDNNGELEFGYLLARCAVESRSKNIQKIVGVSEMAAVYRENGTLNHVVTVPNVDVQKLIAERTGAKEDTILPGHFVEILTGPAVRYCGQVKDKTERGILVEVNFPSGRHFLVTAADETALKLLKIPPSKWCFWGEKL